MPIIAIGNKVNKSAGRYWTPSFWVAQNIFDSFWAKSAPVANKLVDISGNGNDIVITGCDFTTPYIPVTSSASFKMPEVAALKTDDSDGIWWKTDDSARGADKTSIAELIGYDFARTIVFYADSAPYHIYAIGLLKSSVTLTTEQKNKLRDQFRLSVWWDGTLSMHGYVKGNRGESQAVWTPESTIPADFSGANVFGFYDFAQESTITKDGSNLVSKWADRNGSGHDYNLSSGFTKPLLQATGILYNGESNKMETDSFTLNQPVYRYSLIKQVSFTNGDTLFDGKTRNSALLFQSDPTPKLTTYAGSSSGANAGAVIGEWHIVIEVLNGASSKLQVDSNAPVTGNFGSAAMGGATMGDRGAAESTWAANFEIRVQLIRTAAPADEAAIITYLNSRKP